MSGPKSGSYQVSAARQAQIAEEQAVRSGAAEHRLLSEELARLGHLASETAKRLGVEILTVPGTPLEMGSSAHITDQNRRLKESLATLRVAVDEARQRGEVDRARDYLRGLDEIIIPTRAQDAAPAMTLIDDFSASDDTPVSPSEERTARAELYVADLTPGAELSPRALMLLTQIASSPAERAELALSDLQVEIAHLNKHARRRQQVAKVLDALLIRAETAGSGSLHDEIAHEREHLRGTDERLIELEAAVRDAEAAALATQRRATARAAMLEALSAEGYEVLDGFETSIPDEGVLVHKPTDDHHAWEVIVDEESVRLQVVRTRHDSDPGRSEVRDREAEERICNDLPAVMGRLRGAGVEIPRLRQLAPGDVPVKALAVAAAPSSNTHTRAAEQRVGRRP